MALVGLIRVSTQTQETQRQHDALDPICVKVFEEKVSGKLAVADRDVLRDALDYIRPGDMLTVQEVDRLGRNLLIEPGPQGKHNSGIRSQAGFAATAGVSRDVVSRWVP